MKRPSSHLGPDAPARPSPTPDPPDAPDRRFPAPGPPEGERSRPSGQEGSAVHSPARDPGLRAGELGARLLLTERDALLPILRRTPAAAFDRPTELVTDTATLVRLCSSRRPDPARYTLRGADPDRYHLFR